MIKVVKKSYDFLLLINTIFLVFAAILTATGNYWGSAVFVYTQIIGLIDAISNKQKNGIIICSTFLAMNLYFLIK